MFISFCLEIVQYLFFFEFYKLILQSKQVGMIFKNYLVDIVSFIVLFLVSMSPFSRYLHSQKWIIFAFFVSLNFLVTMLVDLGMKNNREKFIQFYLSAVVIRIVLILMFIGFGIFKFKENRNLFVINTIVLYLFFTIFEISIFIRKLRRF